MRMKIFYFGLFRWYTDSTEESITWLLRGGEGIGVVNLTRIPIVGFQIISSFSILGIPGEKGFTGMITITNPAFFNIGILGGKWKQLFPEIFRELWVFDLIHSKVFYSWSDISVRYINSSLLCQLSKCLILML